MHQFKKVKERKMFINEKNIWFAILVQKNLCSFEKKFCNFKEADYKVKLVSKSSTLLQSVCHLTAFSHFLVNIIQTIFIFEQNKMHSQICRSYTIFFQIISDITHFAIFALKIIFHDFKSSCVRFSI